MRGRLLLASTIAAGLFAGGAAAQNGTSPYRYGSPYSGLSVGFAVGGAGVHTDYVGANFDTSGTTGTVCADAEWDVALRYAGEFAGFRRAVAAAQSPVPFVGVTASLCHGWGSVSEIFPGNGLPHATKLGLFGDVGARVGIVFPNLLSAPGAPAGWMVQSGIRKDWWAPGTTTVYGMFGVAFGQVQISVPGFPGANDTRTGSFVGAGVEVVTSWGAGVAQNIDAAAAALFVEYKHFDLGTENAQLGGVVPVRVTFDQVQGGLRFKY
jgi:hypothetical protein